MLSVCRSFDRLRNTIRLYFLGCSSHFTLHDRYATLQVYFSNQRVLNEGNLHFLIQPWIAGDIGHLVGHSSLNVKQHVVNAIGLLTMFEVVAEGLDKP